MFTANSVLNTNEIEKKGRSSIFKYLPIAFVLVAGIAVSIVGKNLLDYKTESDRQAEFDKSVSSVMSRMENSLGEQEQTLTNLNELFKASVQVVRDVFELYSTVPAKSNPSILSIAYASNVKQSQLSDFIYYNRSERYYDYAIHPAGNRPEMEPVSYVIPYEKNSKLSGFDLLSNPVFADLVKRARTNKGIVVSPMFNFRGGDTNSIVLMIEAERHKEESAAGSAIGSDQTDESLFQTSSSKFDGVIFVELDAQKFFANTIGDSVGTDKNIVFDCLTTDLMNKTTKVFSSKNSSLIDPSYKQIVTTEKSIAVGNRTFTLRFANAPGFGSGMQAYMGWAVFGAGILSTLLFSGFLLSVITSKQRALALANRITASNRRILESSNDMIAVFDMSGVIKAINPAVNDILGYDAASIEQHHISAYLIGDGVNQELADKIKHATDETAFPYDVRMKALNGASRWISWSFTPSQKDGVIYAVGRDVTEAKIAEQQIKLKSKQVELAEQIALEANEFKSSFLMRLTDHLRDSLTDTLSGLHRISSQIDFSDEKQLKFLQLANHSSDQLFNIVNDLLDVAQDRDGTSADIKAFSIHDGIRSATDQLANEFAKGQNIRVIKEDIHPNLMIKGDSSLLSAALGRIFAVMSEGMSASIITINAEENTYESVVEIQILSMQNDLVAEMIKKYNVCSRNLIDSLHEDKENIMFRLGVASSQLRRISATMSVETLGSDGNVALITIPMAKQ
ncbi:MAG: CHASE domain-containing protein [Candidatus Kapabacteria bacterium]|nr:CHASE domain-containing protein [Candidatus Kapabacteria bacterium]